MFEKTKLVNSLTKEKDGLKLVNVKFFKGSHRFVDEESFCEQVSRARSQVASGSVKALESVDGSFVKRTVQEFLS